MSTEGCVSIGIAIVSLLVAAFTWYHTHQKRKYEVADQLLSELHRLAITYPQFRNPEACVSALTSTDMVVRYRYDAYAVLVWNYLETLYDTYGTKLNKTPFYGAMLDLGTRHRQWLFTANNLSFYNHKLIKFLQVER